MPQTIRVPTWLTPDPNAFKRNLWHGKLPSHQLKRSERDKQIIEMKANGVSTSKIAAKFLITKRHAQRIITSSESGTITR